MEYIRVIKENLDQEHICCAISNNKDVHLSTKKDARNAPTPVTTYALFYDGEYQSNEILSDKKFLKMIKA